MNARSKNATPKTKGKKNKRFALRRFTRLDNTEEMLKAANTGLRAIGKGSSRAVFAYSGGKALKIALDEKGFAQNAAEKAVFDNTNSRSAVAAVYNVGGSNNKIMWLISQIVRPVRTEEEFADLSGFSWDTFTEVIKEFAKSNAQDDIKKITSKISEQFSKRATILRNHQDERNAKYYEEKLKEIAKMETSPLVNGITSAMAINRLMPGDLSELEHYGKTTDGRVVLLDYGFTEDVAAIHYPQKENTEHSKEKLVVSPTIEHVGMKTVKMVNKKAPI